jgi:flagellar hook-associated protein 1
VSISSLLNTSRDSLQSYQLALDLTGANIANANTPGYSRQRVVFNSVGRADVGAVNVQIGVRATNVERIYDEYLDNQVVDQSRKIGYGEAKSDVLNRIEGIFAENGGGASDQLNKFWNAWSELSTNPNGQVERENLLAAAEDMTATFRRLDSDLTVTAQDAGYNIHNTIEQLNEYLSQVVDLNRQITGVADDRGETNLLRDNRTILLNKISNIIDIQYVEDSNGAINIFLADGRPLITGDGVLKLTGKSNQSNIVDDIVFQDNPGVSLKNVLSQGKNGKLAALLEINNVVIPGYRDKLDAIANNLVTEVNAQHRQGYDVHGDAGGEFFDITTGAKNFRINAAIASDTNKIAASSTVNGDGDNARSIDVIKDKLVMNGGTATISDYYASLIGQIGRDVAGAKNSLDQQTSIMQQLTNRREATSGVSLDEEMMDIIKYQMAYNAAGKMVNTVNELMDTILSLVK